MNPTGRSHRVNYRSFVREPHRARLLVLPQGGGEYIEALGIEYSRGGMHFETDVFVAPGSHIDIQPLDPVPVLAAFQQAAGRPYPAQAKWCIRLDQPSSLLYAVGVRFRICSCDWCGITMPCRWIALTGEKITLCPSCLSDLELMKDGKLKDTVKKRLQGNVI